MESHALRVHAASDLGRKRTRNEDSHAVWIPDDPDERARRGVLLVVADGIGGTPAGDVASRFACGSVVSGYGTSDDGADPLESLRSAVEEANRYVHDASHTRSEWAGMGTTCTALVVRNREVWVAHVGDSRAYLLREGQAHQLTEDHSLVATMVRRRELTVEQARSDSRRNLVTRGIGLARTVEVDAGRIESALEPGDTLILCSDGLHGQISDQEMAGLVTGRPLETVCRDLVDLANHRGGPDNITVVAARLEPAELAEVPEHDRVVGDAHTADRAVAAAAPVGEAPATSPPYRGAERRGVRRAPESSPAPFLALLMALAIAVLALMWWIGRGTR